ncbi:GEVED domain-containing protein [Fuerstiella marisgermanici]|uniref:Fibronectin type III domain protein n=1 Tax=Fuerstiella marisgermanici TaxID=1891926 RepID=A0A1P8WK44_9PLAN|nr:GEVED domain-containing protein [Fuerstiella marisgermanici]APZ94408.1 Fibronectin type III domain protein [Fuerstiella marisgermanici]
MLISTWLQSFRSRLQSSPRRPNRRTPEQAATSLEHLESRHLLAAPQLIDVQDEANRVIAEDSEINYSPSAFTLDFSTAPDLDPGTIGTSFTLERAGQDGAFDGNDVIIPLTFVGVGSDVNEVLLQLSQPLPSDLYRINISGALANSGGEAFNGGVGDTFDFSIQLPPPSVVAVRPNVGEFLQPGETRHIAPNELTLQFNPGQVIDPLTINTGTVRVERAGHDGSFGDGNEEFVDIGFVGIGDVPEEVVVRFAENLPDDDYRILLDGSSATPIRSIVGETLNNGADTTFEFSLDLGARIIAVDPQPVTRDGSGVISQARDQIVLYFNDDDMPAAVAQDVQFYQLIFTNDTISNLDDNDLDNNPATGPQIINPQSVVYDAATDTATLLFSQDIHLLAGAGTYRLRVGTNEAIPLTPVQNTFNAIQDPGDSFDSSSLVSLGDLANSANKSHVISSAIEAQPYPFDYPGGIDEPGHRDIEIETHLNGGPDSQAGTSQINYNFQDVYGFDPAGQILLNTITEAQKQRAREVFEYYSTVTGIDVQETLNSGLTIATGDLRALDPLVPTGPGGVTGIAGGGVAIMDQAEVWDDSPGASWFQTAMHEIGHLLSIGHASDLSPVTVNAGDGFGNTNPGAFNGFAEPVFPGDNDLVHLQYLHRPDSIDIDLYEFEVTEPGQFTAEVMAERLADASQLDSHIRLFRENADGSREAIAQNDDYFSEDSYLELNLDVGKYFIGVSSTGNDSYDPAVPGTGAEGTSQGKYDLRLNFRPSITGTGNILQDTDGTAFDGDSDGVAGGVYNFWFRATAPGDTLLVDKEAADKDVAGRANNGSEASPFLEIDQALAAATPGQIVRIVGNGGADNDITTIEDNTPYQIGTNTSNQPLIDGSTLSVPQGVTVMIDAGAMLKLRASRIGVGSSTAGSDRSAGALQILGTPGNDVVFTSWLDETVGTDTTPIPTSAIPGNWGGIVFRNDVDRAEGRFNYQDEGIFLNYIGHADVRYGGGNVIVDSVLQPISPINITEAQPTIVHNTITRSLDSGISADPDSFEENTFHAPKFQEGTQAFTSDYQRVGPDIYWNTLIDNSTNGIFIRAQTTAGAPTKKLTVSGRFDDTDIVHVVAQNLEIQGTPGGPILVENGPDSALMIVSPRSVAGGSLTAGSYTYRLTFVGEEGFESPASAVTPPAIVTGGTSNSVVISGMPSAPPEYAGRRLYRSDPSGSGTFTLVAELGRSESNYLDDGTTLQRVLDTTVTSRSRGRFDARLAIDPGLVVKLQGARIESEIGAQFIAEAQPGREIIFTSRLDDRYGAGGTFDTNDDGDLVSALTVFFADNFEGGQFDAADWSASTTATIDDQGLGETSGSLSAHLVAGTEIQTTSVNLVGQAALELQFSYQRTGGGSTPDADLFVQYRNSIGNWVTLQSLPAAGTDMTQYLASTVSLPAAAIHVNSAVRFGFGNPNTSNARGTVGDWFVDDVRIVESRTNSLPGAGDWGGIYVGHLGSASIDQSLITFGGGVIPVENDFAGFNAIEIHQADARITNSVLEENATGRGGSAPGSRYGLFSNSSGTIFVRGAQPVIVGNDFRSNLGPVISINANALNSNIVADRGRSTGFANAFASLVGNQGPLIDDNRLGNNSINGMLVRPATLTTQSVWDDTDIVHVLTEEILVPDHHTFGGLRLESSSAASLVVKLLGANAGFTANGYPIDIDDRIGGSLQIIGQPGQPVVLTSLNDDGVGAGFDLRGFPLRDTNNDGPSVGSPNDWRSVRIDQYAHDRNVRVVVESEVADRDSADVNNTVGTSEVLGLLAPDVKSGDENLRLGFQIHGAIDSIGDQDMYSFEGEAGTHVWLDIDRTSVGLDSVVELLDSNGNILAQSDNTLDEENGVYPVFTDGSTQAFTLEYSRYFTRDLYTTNAADAGMRVTLPGAVGVRQSYFIRVRSSNLNASFAPTVVFSDDFETGSFRPTHWATVVSAEVDGTALSEPSGVVAARLNTNPAGADRIESVDIDLAAAAGASVVYSYQRTGGGDSPEPGEDLVLSYRNAAGVWIELERQLGAGADMNQFQKSIVNLPAAALHATFALRFSTSSVGGGTTDDWFVDDVRVETLPDINDRTSLQSNSSIGDGLTAGTYQLQVRLQDVDEFPGSQVTNADVRYASTGIEVIGQPIHGLITGEAEETGGVTVLPNVLNTDRAAISISGSLDISNADIDFYQFEVAYDVTQTIAGDGDDAAHVPVTFDLDYADGFSSANTTIAVFNSANELILIGRDSNIGDDKGKLVNRQNTSAADIDDITRGSNGSADGFIGPVELISGTYTLAVFNNDRLPSVLNQFYVDNPTEPLIRLEPLNSTRRIAEERFYPSTFVFNPVTGQIETGDFPITSASPPVTDLFEVNFGGDIDPQHVVPFHLGDVTLFVSQNGSTKPNDQTAVRSVDPFTGAVETVLGGFNIGIGDIAMRADGQLHALSTTPPTGTNIPTDGLIGNYLQIDTGNGSIANRGDDGITTQLLNPQGNGVAAHDVGIQFNAMTYSGSSNGNDTADLWVIGDRTTLGLKNGQNGSVAAAYTSNILYNLNLANSSVDGNGNVPRTGNGGFSARDGAGTPEREWGFVDTTFNNGGLQGQVTGMVTLDGGSSFYVVDDAGGLYRVERSASGGQTVDPKSASRRTFFNRIRTTFIRNIGADLAGIGGLNLNFQGLTLGPENVEGGLFAQTLFGITQNGDMYAFDTTGELQPVFVDGQTSISTGLNGANGLAFSTLDYNLWHVTSRRGSLDAADDGHGVDVNTFDDSVFLPEPGGNSLYFGFEGGGNTPDPSFGGNRESGNKNTAGDNSILNSVNNNLDFPGGAYGSVVSNEFSLEGYSAEDKPSLYFSYWLQTETPEPEFDHGPNPDTLMHDSFRVFVQDEGGQWRLLSTNNSYEESDRPDEFDIGADEVLADGLSNNPSRQNFPDVVETFDTADWRQAKVDLSNYAGQSSLKLRFDFSTAGSMDVGNLGTTGIELYAVSGAELVDGDTFTLSTVDQFGNNTGFQTFEFDLGAQLTVPTGNAAIGQTFTVTGLGFSDTFTFSANPTTGTDILTLPSDSAATLAERANAFLNAYYGGNSLQMADGGSIQNESFRYFGTNFTFTANPLLPSDILAEVGDTAATIAARTAQTVNTVLGAGSAFPNGDIVDLFIVGGGGVEFGGALDVPTPFGLEGESFTVLGQTFTFTANPKLGSDIDIAVNTTSADIAQQAATVINTVLGAGTALYDAGAPTRISVPNLPTVADAFFTGGTMYLSDVATPSDHQLENFTIGGVTFTFTDNPTRPNDILAAAGETAATIAARVRTAIDGALGVGTVLPVAAAAPERVSVPSIPFTANSFQRGGTIVIQSVNQLEGYQFELNGVAFRFTDNPTRAADILTRQGDDPLAVAAEATRIINNNFGAGTAIQDLVRVTIPNLSSPLNGIYEGARLNFSNATPQNVEGDSFTLFGTTFTFTTSPTFGSANAVDIVYNSTTTADDFATLAATAINNALAADGLIPRATAFSSTADELIGIDFGPAGDLTPTNWNASGANAGTPFSLTNLQDELGNATKVDLDVAFFPGTTGGTVSSTPDNGNLPTHTSPLDNIDGALSDEAGLAFSFTDLEPNATYEIYVFAGDTNSTSSQNVSIFDANGFSGFTQAWTNNQLVNGQASSNANLNTFAVTAVADSSGAFAIQVTETAAADDVIVPAVAIKKIANPPYVEIAGGAGGLLGTSFVINGPDAAAVNGDTIDVDFFPFTYVGGAPGNSQEIQTDVNEIVVANNTVTQLNAFFQNFGFTNWTDAFRTGTRVNIPSEAEINYTTSGPNNSLRVSDYARLRISPADAVAGDVLTYRNVSFTFTDTTTPTAFQIGSDGAGNWDGDDIVAAIDGFFGADESFNVAGEVYFLQDPGFSGALLTYNDPGSDGLTILDDGSGGNPFFFTEISRPAGALLLIDEIGSPLVVDAIGTSLFHDQPDTAIGTVGGGPSVVNDNRVTIRSATSLTTPGTTLLVSGRAGSNTGGNPTILIDPTMSESEVALAIRQGMADIYAASDINNIKGHENLVRLIRHDIVDPGPLQFVQILPGDEFGAFSGPDAGYVNSQAAQRPGSVRGMANDVEGLYLDDIIIGFAERGEMVTNAPAGNGFMQNPDVDDSGAENKAEFNEFGEFNVNLDILNGVYDVEIRTSTNYGLSQLAQPTNVLYRTLDTNDREVQGIAVTLPNATLIPDRSTFSVSNGINTVNYQFIDTRGSNTAPDPGHIAVPFEPIFGTAGTAQDNQEEIARRVATAINSQASQDALTPAHLTDQFGVQAIFSDTDDAVVTTGNSRTLHLTGNASIQADPALSQLLQITVFNATGDSNRLREQGQIIIQSSFVRDSGSYGILVDNGNRADGLAHPGSVRTTQEVNTQRLVPGVVVSNNVIANNGTGGIFYSGDAGTSPNGVASVGRIVNNTVVGSGGGTGITVNQGASPTLLNNIVANFNLGIDVNAASAVIGSTLFQNNNTNSNAGLGTFSLVLAPNEPLFVDAASGNYYPAPGSKAIDSSLESLGDNPEIVRVKTPLGGGLSPLLAPQQDVYGQVRGDGQGPLSGQGGFVFIDRGAIDRVDVFPPIAVLTNPEDNALSDIDPDIAEVWVNLPSDLREFRVRLEDQGIGIDDSKVNTDQFTLSQDGVPLIEGVHYVWAYNSVNNDVIFTAVTSFEFERRYTIEIANQPIDPLNPNSIGGVQDLAGEYLAANQLDGTTVFQILVTDGVNDPPINHVPPNQTMNEGSTLVFSEANGTAITVSDADVHLADDPRLNVVLSTSTGLLTLGSTTGLTFPTGNTGTSEASITFFGSITDINNALDGLSFVPPDEYFNLLPLQDPASRTIPPATITIATDDTGANGRGQFTGPPNDAPEFDTDVIEIDVISVNDPPTFDPPSNLSAIDEDTVGVQTVANYVTGITPGPPSESAQTTSFVMEQPVILEGNLVFLQAPTLTVDASLTTATLTYEVAPNTNGRAQFTFTLVDADASDPNHVPASSAPFTAELVVNPVNDAPFFTLNSTTETSNEDDGVVGPIDLIASVAVGPVDATDETTLPATIQTPTFQTTSPVVTNGNLVFTQFAVSADGKLTYEAAANTAGTATFDIWLVDDGPTTHPLDDNQADALTITVTVNAQPDPPVPSTPNYVIDLGDALNLDASATTDPDLEFPGPPTEELLYSWDLNGDSVFDLVDLTTSQTTVSAVDLANLNLTVPGVNNITLQVTDTYAGTSVTTTATLTIHTVDYGDAPDANYGTLKPNGAAHTFVDGFHLGATIDTELDGQADDGADEDGIVFDPGMQADGSFALESFFTANASAAGKLDIWIDFNNDGDFDPAEHLNGGTSYDLVAGDNTFNFTIAAGSAVTGVDTYARARFSSAGSLAPTGRADDGEVEDYQFQISPLLDATEVTHVLPMWSQTSDLTPLLQWQDSAGTPAGANVTYNIELRNASDQVVGFEEGHTSQSISLSDPLPPGVYTAYVTAFNRAGEAGPISQLDTFEVVAIAVTSPTGNQTNGLPPITFTPIDKTDHYELQIQSALTGATVFEDLNVPGTASSYTLASELPIGEYRSRVRAIEDTTGQVGDWSAFSQFAVRTAPVITAPIGTIADATPTVTWNSVPGAATYDVRITNITDATSPQIIAGVAGLTVDVTQVLPLGEYTVEVRGVTGEGYQAAWTTAETFVVAIPPVISQPGGRLPDSTPTIAWSAVNGADHYDIEIVNTVTSQVAYELLAVTGTQHTVPAASSLPLGNYEVRVKASNVPAAASTGSTVSVLSLPATFTVSTPPEILTPAVGIYDSTPEFTWTEATGAVSTEIEIRDFVNNNVVFTQAGITGTSFTIPAGSALPPGGYEARIRSYGDAAGTVLSDWSTLHVFQIGAAPVAHGPTEGIGQPDFRKTNSPRPTLTAQQSLAGVTFEFWLTDVMAGKTVTVARNLTSSSWTVPTDLPVGRYRYWVRATTDLGEQSPWSDPFDFEVTTPPVMNPIGPTFNPRPTFSWNSQPEIDTYQVWINKVDVVPAQIIRIEDGVVGTSYQLPEDLPNGRYKVWTRGSVTGENAAGGTTVTTWSNGETFEVGGRPQVVPIGNTSDNTPLISWSEVAGRSTFELYLAEQGSEGTPVIRVNDLTTTSYQVTGALNSGEWIVWVRAKSADGRVSPWSTTAQGRFSVNAATTPVVDAIPTSNDRTPTFNWTSATGAARYEIYVSPKGDTQNPVIRVDTITATTYTPTTPLAPGTYRVWVRAINAANATGNWSTVVEFTITANVNQRVAGDQPDVMLTSVDPTVNEFQQEDVTISLIPARVVEDSGRSVHPAQANVSNDSAEVSIEVPATEPSLVAETDEAAIANSDSVMSNWDDAIWAEESAAPTVGSPQVAEVTTETPSEGAKGWMAGLALLTPSLRRRRRQKKD